jgi:hypothetical protein
VLRKEEGEKGIFDDVGDCTGKLPGGSRGVGAPFLGVWKISGIRVLTLGGEATDAPGFLRFRKILGGEMIPPMRFFPALGLNGLPNGDAGVRPNFGD